MFFGIARILSSMILGIDEVGRGPWAGPLVVGAVVLPESCLLELTDSKKLSAKRRALLDVQIRETALGWGLGWVHAKELDTVGLPEALKLATKRAVENIKTPYHEIIIDGTVNFLRGTTKERYVTMLPKADALIPSVSAASIIAKVARDAFMAEQDAQYPGYGFARHVGYGTAAHQAALALHGVTPIHRQSFAPITRLLGQAPRKAGGAAPKSSGAEAEDRAAAYLQAAGHEILERNWKNRFAEIDIISRKDGRLYFTEVKYRRSDTQGGALAAITPTKLRQMRFAAELYMSSTDHQECILAVIGITGTEHPVYLEIE